MGVWRGGASRSGRCWHSYRRNRGHHQSQPALKTPGARWRLSASAASSDWAAGSGLATWASIALGTYLVAAAVDNGFSESAGGLLLFAGSAASILGRVSAGRLADHIGSPGFGVFASLAAAGAVVFALLPAASGARVCNSRVDSVRYRMGLAGTHDLHRRQRESRDHRGIVGNCPIRVCSSAQGRALFSSDGIADRWSFDAAWLVVAVGLAGAATIGMARRSQHCDGYRAISRLRTVPGVVPYCSIECPPTARRRSHPCPRRFCC